MKSVLCVAAHPDDEVLGAGATLARFAGEGAKLHLLILGEGITSRRNADPQSVSNLDQHAKEASEVLGIESLMRCHFPDNRMDTIPLLEIIHAIEAEKERINPDLVLTHFGGDLNIDHRICFETVMTAFRPLPNQNARAIWCFEAPSSTGWAGPLPERNFSPDIFVEITSHHLKKKLQAMSCYTTEARSFPHPRSPEALQAMAQYRGSQVGLEFAEAFSLARHIITIDR